jgi:hypothetical protein
MNAQPMRIISADERLAEKSDIKVRSVYGLHAVDQRRDRAPLCDPRRISGALDVAENPDAAGRERKHA